MSVTVTELTENPHNDGMWAVMDDGLCYTRCETEAEAQVYAMKLEHEIKISDRVTALMDQVSDDIINEFGLLPADAQRAMQEYLQ